MPALPALGMQALAQPARAEPRPPGRARRRRDRRDRAAPARAYACTPTAATIEARAAVVATDPTTASTLLGLGIPDDARPVHAGGSPPDVPPTTMKMPFVNPMGPADRPDLARARRLQRRARATHPPGTAPRVGVLRSGSRARTSAARPRPRCAPSSAQIFRTDTSVVGPGATATSHAHAWPVARPPLIGGREVDLGDGLFVGGRPPATAEHPRRHALRSPRGRAVLEELGQPAEGLELQGRSPTWPRRSSTFSAAGTASSRSSGTRPMRVRRSSRSSTVAAPSWVTPKTSSARVAWSRRARSARAARPRAGRSPRTASGDHGGGLHPEATHQPVGCLDGRPSSVGDPAPSSGRSAGPARARGQARAGRDRLVDGVLGHPAVGGQLAADHGHHPGPRDEHRVLAGDVGRGACPVSSSGRRPA